VAIFEPLFQALNDAGARYVVVGGVATVLHGYARLTADVDLIVDLEETEALKVIDALVSLGYESRVPVQPRDFADRNARESWIREKNMQVFSLWDPRNPMRVVDLFVASPIDFESLWARSEVVQLKTTTVRIASIDDLIRLKEMAGRDQDLADIERLAEIRRRRCEST
jgi:predicted nucleotidyltransferase